MEKVDKCEQVESKTCVDDRSTRSISESVEYLKQFFLENLYELLELISGLARENEISESTSL